MFGYLADRPSPPASSRQHPSRLWRFDSQWTMIAVLVSVGCLFLPGSLSASARASASHCQARHRSKVRVKGATLRATITWKCGSVRVTGSAFNRSAAPAAVFIGSGKALFGDVSVASGYRAKINTGWWATKTPETIAGTITLNVVVYTQPPATRGVVVHLHMAR
jgi:hypothetical protein